MDKADIKNQPIKITFLEINPPLNELIKAKEEINIIFQGNDNFYDLKKFLSSKIPIQLNRYKKSLIITLLKSNNIFATGLLTIRPGEQYIILNYENKKKIISTKAVNINNLAECIKIKILCEYENNNINNIRKKEYMTNHNSNSYLTDKNFNDSGNKYVPKVNLMKSSHFNNLKNKNNNNAGKIYEKKKKLIGNYYGNNTFKKKSINSSQEFSMGGEYSAYLTEEINNNMNHNLINNNFNTNEIKKLNPYCSSKLYNNMTHKTEIEMSAKAKALVNKAKSKNYFSTIKKQYRQNCGSQIKMNNSSANLINQKNSIHSIDNNENNNINRNNPITNRFIKPTTSFIKNSKRNTANINKNTNYINNKNLINSIDNLITGQIIEHFDKSKKENNNKINTNSAKKKFVNINKNINNNYGKNSGLNNNENKKKKFNNNNITMNSISTDVTKKNELEFSINSFLDYKDYEDKNNIIKNNNIMAPLTNRTNNERLQHKLNEKKTLNRNMSKHKFNKSLCQQSFIEKIINENDLNINMNENELKKNSNLCKSYDRLINENNKLNFYKNEDKDKDKENKIINERNTYDKNGDVNKKDINEFDVDVDVDEEENLEMENYTRLKEDFNLLYNNEYIEQINEDLLKLEIELFFEKMSELFSAYHLIMDEKIMENYIIKRDYKNNIAKYLLYKKLYNKLQYAISEQQTKRCNLKDKGIYLDKQNYENVNINMNELNIFKFIFPDENKSKKLKKIISIILKKQGKSEILDENIKKLLK